MSRLKKFTHSLVSGYMQAGVNVLYTLASVPLALHYLSKDEFGLWQVAMAIAGYLMLIDFGMTGSAGRILIDYKDDPAGGAYGSVIKISAVVLSIQGLAIAVIGTVLSFWLPQLMKVDPEYQRPLFFLIAGQCLLQGFFFVGRVFGILGGAHQRSDLYNYTSMGTLLSSFAALWIAFHEGLGIYSMLAGSAVGSVFGFFFGWTMAWRCRFFPPRGCWGRFDSRLFKEIFFFGSDQFLMIVGFQLVNASQVLIISHTLGLGAAAVWSVAIKPFVLGQQLVGRIFDFSASALSEMIVRGERERLVRRFRDVVILTAAVAIFIGGGIALCNAGFMHFWTKGLIAWNPLNDFLLALWFIVISVTRCNVGFTALTKQIGSMRYIYFLEGVTFVVAAVCVAPRFGIPGIITAAIVADLAWSGICGTLRTSHGLRVPAGEIVKHWLARPAMFLCGLTAVLIAFHFLTGSLTPAIRLGVNAAFSGVLGLWLLWHVALSLELRAEIKMVLSKIKTRLRSR